jgi:outer membrane murein-binding lipoprotein Lpp
MKSKFVLILTIIAVLLSCLFAGCGISQEEYDRVSAQLTASQAQVVELQNEIRELKEQYEIVGETPAETAENIVKRYHETHIYSKHDFFVCSDMAIDVWNMLKAQEIDALIQIGNTETGAKDITEADHAWVLAETSLGYYLALETTGGYVVYEEDNSLYYRGWSFDNPKEYKRFVELRQEYNTRIGLSKEMWNTFETTRQSMLETMDTYTDLVNEVSGMSMFDPALETKLPELILKAKEMGELVGRCDQLTELIEDQKQKIDNIVSEMRGLTGLPN